MLSRTVPECRRSARGLRSASVAIQKSLDSIVYPFAANPDATKLIGPNIANFAWAPEMVWDTGFVDTFSLNLAYLAVEKYPRDNCAAAFGGPNATVIDPQSVLPLYPKPDAHTQLLAPYLNEQHAVCADEGKAVLMFETIIRLLGGFLGISDSFTPALWGLDYALQMAHSNLSGAMAMFRGF
ncbi:hypothetical protein C8R46DRAFT_1219239 [Mycena filopes]|nr:hypothetical protein C8R46DRAFT_1219239 [Mycena filopes]